jgi:hypothetical protein
MGLVLNSKLSKTFKVLSVPKLPKFEYIPLRDDMREEMYSCYTQIGIELTPYSKFERVNLNKEKKIATKQQLKDANIKF